jgi:hypothetical protein
LRGWTQACEDDVFSPRRLCDWRPGLPAIIYRKEKAGLIAAVQEEIDAGQVFGDPVHD